MNISPEIRLITIDLDDTLWECTPVIQRAEQVLYAWLEQQCPRVTKRYTINEMRERRISLSVAHPHLQHDMSQLRQVSLSSHMREAGYPEKLAEVAFELFLAARNRVELYEDVRPVLSRLRQRYILAALTNGNADIHKTGIGDLFEFAISAADVGAAKPHPAMFLRACDLAEVSRESAVHVGDSPEHDISGARAAGMRSVWVNRAGKDWPAEHEGPDAVVADLHQLAELLDSEVATS